MQAIVFGFIAFIFGVVHAQDAIRGRHLYTTPFTPGGLSCSSSLCHGPDPMQNIARVRNGTTANDILYAIGRFGVMGFLQGRVSTAQAADLAAYITNPAAANAQPVAMLSTTTVSFAPLYVGQRSQAKRVSLSNTTAIPFALTDVSIDSSEFAILRSACVAGYVLPPGQTCTIDVVYEPKSASQHAAQLSIAHNAQGGVSVVAITGRAQALPSNARLMIEYRIQSLDYYFITSRANEQALLDVIPDFQRTGASFPVLAEPESDASPLVRYYFDQAAKQRTQGIHFYTVLAPEIAALNGLNPSNAAVPRLPVNEGIDSYAFAPAVEGPLGHCPMALQPVLRLFRGNERFPDDPNHRFTLDRLTYDEFVAAGWSGEGVRLCVQAPA